MLSWSRGPHGSFLQGMIQIYGDIVPHFQCGLAFVLPLFTATKVCHGHPPTIACFSLPDMHTLITRSHMMWHKVHSTAALRAPGGRHPRALCGRMVHCLAYSSTIVSIRIRRPWNILSLTKRSSLGATTGHSQPNATSVIQPGPSPCGLLFLHLQALVTRLFFTAAGRVSPLTPLDFSEFAGNVLRLLGFPRGISYPPLVPSRVDAPNGSSPKAGRSHRLAHLPKIRLHHDFDKLREVDGWLPAKLSLRFQG